MMTPTQHEAPIANGANVVAETPDMVDLREQMRQLEATNTAMRAILLVVASGLMSWDPATGIESCRFCSLKRGGEFGYSSKHDDDCIVTRARALGF